MSSDNVLEIEKAKNITWRRMLFDGDETHLQ